VSKMSLKDQLEKLDAMSDSDIDYSDIPANAFETLKRVDLELPKKKLLTVRYDEYVIDWFKATGSGYQTRMNNVLKAYIESVQSNHPQP